MENDPDNTYASKTEYNLTPTYEENTTEVFFATTQNPTTNRIETLIISSTGQTVGVLLPREGFTIT